MLTVFLHLLQLHFSIVSKIRDALLKLHFFSLIWSYLRDSCSFLWSGPFQVRVGCDLKGWCHRPDLMSGPATFIPKWRMTEHFMHSTAVNNLQRDTFHLPFESLIHIVWLFFVLTCFYLFTLYCESFPNCVTYPHNSEKQVKQQCILQHHCVEV